MLQYDKVSDDNDIMKIFYRTWTRVKYSYLEMFLANIICI
jgi:hypothetical protein